MVFQNEWLENQYYTFFDLDHGVRYLRRYGWILWLYKKTHFAWIGHCACRGEINSFRLLLKFRNKKRYIYQDVLTSHLNELLQTIRSNKLPELNNVIIQDIRGFNMFNAESFPCFGDNLIAINSGICFHCHTHIRFIQPIFVSHTHQRLAPCWKKIFLDKFVKASTALICQDHSITFSKWFIIPEDDNLLFGLEQYIILHEYAHLLFRKYSYEDFKFGHYFTQDLVDLIYSNEEIAADAVAIIFLFYHMQDATHSYYTLYAPQFMYRLLSCYESAGIWREPGNHPSQKERHAYISKMIECICRNPIYNDFDRIIGKIWDIKKDAVKAMVEKTIKKYSWRIDVCQELIDRFGHIYNTNKHP